MSRQDDIKKLISIHNQRLQKLREQRALLGLFVDPQILIEIEGIEAKIEKLQAELRALKDIEEPPEDSKPSCPYPGMVPFSAEDARFFYGRKAEINRMVRLLRDRRRLFVIGPSGSGKSSLVFAGVLPTLPKSNFFRRKPWLVRTMRPGSQPRSTLEQIIGGDPNQPGQAVSNLLTTHAEVRQLLLVIDQFEELFTQAKRSEQSPFIAALQALSTVEFCTLVIIIRADFYHDLMNSDFWPVKQGERLEVAPLRGTMLRQAIEQPATQVKVKLEAGLVERLLADAADEPGALPLVQETMVQLWEVMQDSLLSLNAYEQLSTEERSGLAGAMTDKAEVTLDELSPVQQAIARRIFLRLIQFGEGRADTRRQRPVTDLKTAFDDPKLFDQTLNHLTDNRLLTLGGKDRHVRQVDIAHEALIRGWPTLRRWLFERREAERTRRRLEARAADWVRLEGRGGLLDEVQLLEAERWLNSPDATDLGYNEALPALVQASRSAIEEAEQKKEADRRELTAIRQVATLGTATAALQHRINNTLNIIIPNVTRLRRRVDLSDETIQEILDIIERNARYTSDYINRIQEQLKETEIQVVDINATLREAQVQIQHQYQNRAGFGTIEIIYNLDDSLPSIKAPLGQIAEVFCNLIENSYKAMGADGGTLTITSWRTDSWLEVEVQDTGTGIPSNIRNNLFNQPVPSKQPDQGSRGSGLGLWLSALLLQKYAGEIKMADTGPSGTTMLVRLPV